LIRSLKQTNVSIRLKAQSNKVDVFFRISIMRRSQNSASVRSRHKSSSASSADASNTLCKYDQSMHHLTNSRGAVSEGAIAVPWVHGRKAPGIGAVIEVRSAIQPMKVSSD
jgi:hypothetical protein